MTRVYAKGNQPSTKFKRSKSKPTKTKLKKAPVSKKLRNSSQTRYRQQGA